MSSGSNGKMRLFPAFMLGAALLALPAAAEAPAIPPGAAAPAKPFTPIVPAVPAPSPAAISEASPTPPALPAEAAAAPVSTPAIATATTPTPAVPTPTLPPVLPVASENDDGWIIPNAPDEAAALPGSAMGKPEPLTDAAGDAAKSNLLNDQQILALLRSGSTRALTLTDLAAINDMLKRMEYQTEIEKKMAEMNLGLGSGNVSAVRPALDMAATVAEAVPASAPPVATLSNVDEIAAAYSILQISGANGKYVALVSNGFGRSVPVRVGDPLEKATVTAITIKGVSITSEGGSANLPFASPYSALKANVSSNARR